MNRMTYSDQASLERTLILLYAQITMVAGAPVLNAKASMGFASVSLSAAGRLLFTLSEPVAVLLFASATVTDPASTSTIVSTSVRAEALATAKTITVSTKIAAGTETTIANGDGLRLCLHVRNAPRDN